MTIINGEQQVAGSGHGRTLVLDQPISLWDGIDSEHGCIAQKGHANNGQCFAGKVLIVAHGLTGATGGGSIAECLRNDCGPVAVVTAEPALEFVIGSTVAGILYQKQIPVLRIRDEDIHTVANDCPAHVSDGCLTLHDPQPAASR